ncbi:complement factor B-like [Bufo gargarizans]|uniref:complement factor B-like n=1 Tax=Bufo gargarizans TaxID=30331 RepID=UPI001CF36FEF|nr:complement factor B-like [Bufo gargarizans]
MGDNRYKMLPLILLSQMALSIAAPAIQCDLSKIAIAGGKYCLNNGTKVGSKLEYTCPEGTYPYPFPSRECLFNGQWSNENVKAQCRTVQCTTPGRLENGEFYPRKAKYFIGDILYFECWGGFKMSRPENRICQANGKWSGIVTTCDNKGMVGSARHSVKEKPVSNLHTDYRTSAELFHAVLLLKLHHLCASISDFVTQQARIRNNPSFDLSFSTTPGVKPHNTPVEVHKANVASTGSPYRPFKSSQEENKLKLLPKDARSTTSGYRRFRDEKFSAFFVQGVLKGAREDRLGVAPLFKSHLELFGLTLKCLILETVSPSTEGQKILNPKDIAEEFAHYYSSLYNLENSPETFQPTTKTIDEFLKEISLPSLSNIQSRALNTEISALEVLEAIKYLKPNKSPGPDGLTNEYYKSYSSILTPYLTRTFNFLATQGTWGISPSIEVTTGGLMNIFILLDASASLGEDNFNFAKEASEVFIEKMSSFDFSPRYAVISYARDAKPIIELSDEDSKEADKVIDRINAFQYSEHIQEPWGRNTRGALAKVYEMLCLQNVRDPEYFLKTKNVILLITDGNKMPFTSLGKHNMGGDPTVEVKRIREILDIRKNNKRENDLDIYVFGLGEEISHNEINDIASKKTSQHVFSMGTVDDMKKAFDEMIDEAGAVDMCGLAYEPSENEGVEGKYPWIAKITITSPGSEVTCKGSIISRDFILTAAHCFNLDEKLHAITVEVGGKEFKVKDLHRHNKYDPLGKQDKKVEKSFDYDLALIELKTKIEFSRKIRDLI